MRVEYHPLLGKVSLVVDEHTVVPLSVADAQIIGQARGKLELRVTLEAESVERYTEPEPRPPVVLEIEHEATLKRLKDAQEVIAAFQNGQTASTESTANTVFDSTPEYTTNG